MWIVLTILKLSGERTEDLKPSVTLTRAGVRLYSEGNHVKIYLPGPDLSTFHSTHSYLLGTLARRASGSGSHRTDEHSHLACQCIVHPTPLEMTWFFSLPITLASYVEAVSIVLGALVLIQVYMSSPMLRVWGELLQSVWIPARPRPTTPVSAQYDRAIASTVREQWHATQTWPQGVRIPENTQVNAAWLGFYLRGAVHVTKSFRSSLKPEEDQDHAEPISQDFAP